MKYLLVSTALLILVSCKSKKAAETKTDIKVDSVVATSDTNTNTPKQDTSNNANMDRIADLRLGMKDTVLLKIMDKPISKSKAQEWGADGLFHQDWNYPPQGISLNMSSEKNKMNDAEVFSITVTNPSTRMTDKGVGIGSDYDKVMTVYQKTIDKTNTDDSLITVGSVYGGIIFSFKDKKVNKIFIGAAAE